MPKNIVITGEPKSGKSTLLRKLIADITNKVGFLTSEILGKDGRVGFEIETHRKDRAVLAHVDFTTPYKVGKYSVSPQNLESILPKVSDFTRGDILYLDEIGQMQLLSEKFKELALRYMNSPNICLITLSSVFKDSFTESIRRRNDVALVEISTENRKEKEEFLARLFLATRESVSEEGRKLSPQ